MTILVWVEKFRLFITEFTTCSIHAFCLSLHYHRGGILLTVHGQNLNSVQTAMLLVNVEKEETPGVVEQQIRSVSKIA